MSIQEGISNKKAKDLIDKGLVYAQGKKIKLARKLYDSDTKFKLTKIKDIKKIFEDDKIIAIDKPSFIDSYELSRKYQDAVLLHRLDRDTSGVILLSKDEDFRLKAIEEFKKHKVYKEYIAIVKGVVSDEIVIDSPILTIKDKRAISKIHKDGKKAITQITPLETIGKKSKIKVVIKTGRTHQIRVHLSSIGYPILGDIIYGDKQDQKRLYLHASKIKIFDYEFESNEGEDFEI